MSKWKPGTFLVSFPSGPELVSGHIYAGVGLHYVDPGWNVTHLGTGHRICSVDMAQFAATCIATEIAECGDWTFTGLNGYRNTDPDILSRVVKIIHEYADDLRWGGKEGEPTSGHLADVAREIAEANA